MKLFNIFERATDFGSFRSRENFFSFALKCVFYIVPAVILGNYVDTRMQILKENKTFGDYALYYILLETLINILILYLILLFLANYTSEFQVTLAGGFFSVLYFGIQTNYMYMIKEYINNS